MKDQGSQVEMWQYWEHQVLGRKKMPIVNKKWIIHVAQKFKLIDIYVPLLWKEVPILHIFCAYVVNQLQLNLTRPPVYKPVIQF